MIGEYLKADPSIDMLVINAYTDSYGGRWPNLKLSEKRAKTIKNYFACLGIDPYLSIGIFFDFCLCPQVSNGAPFSENYF